MKDDIKFIQSILPSHYVVSEGNRQNSIHCKSEIGIDENDDEHWEYIKKAISQKFNDHFLEIFHNTCTDHLDFTIYLRK